MSGEAGKTTKNIKWIYFFVIYFVRNTFAHHPFYFHATHTHTHWFVKKREAERWQNLRCKNYSCVVPSFLFLSLCLVVSVKEKKKKWKHVLDNFDSQGKRILHFQFSWLLVVKIQLIDRRLKERILHVNLWTFAETREIPYLISRSAFVVLCINLLKKINKVSLKEDLLLHNFS